MFHYARRRADVRISSIELLNASHWGGELADLSGTGVHYRPWGLFAAVVSVGLVFGACSWLYSGRGGMAALNEEAVVVAALCTWFAAPFVGFAMVIEPLTTKRGGFMALFFGLSLSTLTWFGFAVAGHQALSGMPLVSGEISALLGLNVLLLTQPFLVFIGMAVIGWFVERKLRKERRAEITPS